MYMPGQLEQGLHRAVSCYVGAGNQTWVHALTLSHLIIPGGTEGGSYTYQDVVSEFGTKVGLDMACHMPVLITFPLTHAGFHELLNNLGKSWHRFGPLFLAYDIFPLSAAANVSVMGVFLLGTNCEFVHTEISQSFPLRPTLFYLKIIFYVSVFCLPVCLCTTGVLA